MTRDDAGSARRPARRRRWWSRRGSRVVIRPLDAPVARHPAIVVMRGSLAPDGAVLKRTVADDAPLTFRGPAKVVRSRDEGVAAAKAGRFAAGDVVVLTGLGLRGSPGMGLTSALMFAIDGAGLSTSVAVITDGQMSGLVNGGLVIAEVSPEGAAGGPLGLVRDGDLISIDVNARTVDLEVEAAELAARRAALPPLAAPTGCGWLSVYARSVAPLGAGATLGLAGVGGANGGSRAVVVGGGWARRGRQGVGADRSIYGFGFDVFGRRGSQCERFSMWILRPGLRSARCRTPAPGPRMSSSRWRRAGCAGRMCTRCRPGSPRPGRSSGTSSAGGSWRSASDVTGWARGAAGGGVADRVVREVPGLRARDPVPLPGGAEHRDQHPGRLRRVREGAGQAAGRAAAGA